MSEPTVIREYAVEWGAPTDRRRYPTPTLAAAQIEADRYHPQYMPQVVTRLVTTTKWAPVDLNGGAEVQVSGPEPEPRCARCGCTPQPHHKLHCEGRGGECRCYGGWADPGTPLTALDEVGRMENADYDCEHRPSASGSTEEG